MKQRKSILDRVATATDLPSEPLPTLPLVELAGDRRVLIENHRGVMVYGCKEIGIRMQYGNVLICGCNLELAQMTRRQLVITGRIDSISLQRGR